MLAMKSLLLRLTFKKKIKSFPANLIAKLIPVMTGLHCSNVLSLTILESIPKIFIKDHSSLLMLDDAS